MIASMIEPTISFCMPFQWLSRAGETKFSLLFESEQHPLFVGNEHLETPIGSVAISTTLSMCGR